MKNKFPLQPVFIFGCRRSGTTLLRSLLAQHPALLVHPKEPQFILTLRERFGHTLRSKQDAVLALSQHPYLPDTIDQQALIAKLSDVDVQTWPDLVRAYLVFWAGDPNLQKQIVLKDPAFTFQLDVLDALFPEARYIHVVRHPYGNVSSQRARWQNASVWECATWWKQAVTIGHTMAQLHPGRCLEVLYEALVLSPAETLQQICQFLEIAFVPEMLDFTLDTISFSPEKPPQVKQFLGFDVERLDRWRTFLTPEDIRLIEYCCGDEMVWWQYEKLVPPVDNLVFRRRLLKERVGYGFLKNGRFLKKQWRQIKYRMMP